MHVLICDDLENLQAEQLTLSHQMLSESMQDEALRDEVAQAVVDKILPQCENEMDVDYVYDIVPRVFDALFGEIE